MAHSWLVPLQVRQMRKFVLSITTADVEAGPSGIRAQAMGSDGETSVSLKIDHLELCY